MGACCRIPFSAEERQQIYSWSLLAARFNTSEQNNAHAALLFPAYFPLLIERKYLNASCLVWWRAGAAESCGVGVQRREVWL